MRQSAPLSEQALLLLLLIDQNTRRADNGTIERYWMPSSSRGGETIYATGETIVVSGSGVAKSLQALAKRGLIGQTSHMRDAMSKYAYFITEHGHCALEQQYEWIARRKAWHVADIQRRIEAEEAEENQDNVPQLQQQVLRSELATIKMTTGNEKKYSAVIVDGRRVQWVGIGWVDERPATPDDYQTLPVAIDG